ncbi:hypothetical protein F5B22DRAFT_642842 [Xylaria bambusicola]|uniref:uncharacterized protein n=1 Tax=Xylaria bambusicola TaxID=326684 RepID=UPI002007D916|nr:uncharacterized protein F5B22DRAFT_642842 [Xylaria bambusicola]KAI0523742.1 hypothetical protein F5B22DRAFT_642842 [Xylaria bambusicola]
MSSRRTTRTEALVNSRIGSRVNNATFSVDSVNSDDDDEEGGTPLGDFASATPPLDDINAALPRRNDDQPHNSNKKMLDALNNFPSLPNSKLNATRILSWFLGRHLQLTDDNSTCNSRSRARTYESNAHDDYFDIGDVKDICPACTTPYCQAVDSIPFKSSLKLMYNDSISQKWLVGNKYVLHEEVDDHPEDKYVPLVEASRALNTLACNVPTPKVRAGWKENGKVITICDAVSGERLYDIWWDLSSEERESIAKQVARYIEAWRTTDLGRISSLTGGPVYHHDNLFGATDKGFGPFGSDLELWEAIERRLEKRGASGDMIQLLKDYMPSSSPCVFTHGDLSSTNIFVHNGSVSAITGFENAASLPLWAENVAMHFCSCPEDEQWKELLSQHTRNFRAALDWWSLWTAVEDADTDSARLESLRTRCERWRKTEIHGEPFWSIWLGHEGGPSKRLNIQTAENAVEARVGDLVRQAIASDLLQQGSYEDVAGDPSWGNSTEEDDENAERKPAEHGLTPFHPIQQQHHTLVTSANRPPRHTRNALSRADRRKINPKPLTLDNLHLSEKEARHSYAAMIESDFSDPYECNPDAESSDAPSIGTLAKSKGLRPLSLPSIALSESARSQLRRAGEEDKGTVIGTEEINTHPLISVREADGDTPGFKTEDQAKEKRGEKEPHKPSSPRTKRTSMFGNRAAPGSFYAALSAASTEVRPRRHGRSKSEGRTGGGDNVRRETSRLRPQSMLQPVIQDKRDEDDRNSESGDEKPKDYLMSGAYQG